MFPVGAVFRPGSRCGFPVAPLYSLYKAIWTTTRLPLPLPLADRTSPNQGRRVRSLRGSHQSRVFRSGCYLSFRHSGFCRLSEKDRRGRRLKRGGCLTYLGQSGRGCRCGVVPVGMRERYPILWTFSAA